LVVSDFIGFEVRVKHVGLVAFADAMSLYYDALQSKGDAKRRLLLVRLRFCCDCKT
jgi:hypothetical protein